MLRWDFSVATQTIAARTELGGAQEISRGIAIGRSIRGIGECLGRAPSTVSREVARHGGQYGYRATEADRGAWDAARRAKQCLLSSASIR
jgi:IS30 family transposase